MLCTGCLIILDGQSVKKNQFRKFPYLSGRGCQTAEASRALDPLGPPPPNPNSVKNT